MYDVKKLLKIPYLQNPHHWWQKLFKSYLKFLIYRTPHLLWQKFTQPLEENLTRKTWKRHNKWDIIL